MSAGDSLQPRQFWDAEEEPGVAWHVSHPGNRESIEAHGLRPGRANDTWEPGVYLHRSLAGVTSYRQNGDLYKVDTSGMDLHADAFIPHISSYSKSAVASERVRRVGSRVDEGVIM